MKKRGLILAMLGCLLISGTETFAQNELRGETLMEERMLQPRYENISMAQAGLTASGSALKLRASIKTFSRVNITITIKLQKKRDNSWITVQSWSNTYADKTFVELVKTYTGSSNSTYRVVASFAAGNEATTSYSNSVTI